MFKTDIESEILPYCGEHNIGVVVYSPMQAGLLSGKFNAERAASLPLMIGEKGIQILNDPILSINLKCGQDERHCSKTGVSMAVHAIAGLYVTPR
jgi:aryl-alcohol dehydrogenase-like predicted oxidoreductase